jgi:GNAT superfamily N-acetyltransferase
MGPGKPVSIRHCAIYTPKSSETLCFFDRGELGRRRKYADRCEATRMKIRIPPVNESPDDADVHFLDDRINQYNFETTGITDGRIISFFVRDESGDIIAGLYGWTWGGTCAVRYLWVRADHRKRGCGTALMEAAEREAHVRGCTQIVLSTHSFQAPRFYERLGFEIIGTNFDYPRGHQKHYLRRKLTK